MVEAHPIYGKTQLDLNIGTNVSPPPPNNLLPPSLCLNELGSLNLLHLATVSRSIFGTVLFLNCGHVLNSEPPPIQPLEVVFKKGLNLSKNAGRPFAIPFKTYRESRGSAFLFTMVTGLLQVVFHLSSAVTAAWHRAV